MMMPVLLLLLLLLLRRRRCGCRGVVLVGRRRRPVRPMVPRTRRARAHAEIRVVLRLLDVRRPGGVLQLVVVVGVVVVVPSADAVGRQWAHVAVEARLVGGRRLLAHGVRTAVAAAARCAVGVVWHLRGVRCAWRVRGLRPRRLRRAIVVMVTVLGELVRVARAQLGWRGHRARDPRGLTGWRAHRRVRRAGAVPRVRRGRRRMVV